MLLTNENLKQENLFVVFMKKNNWFTYYRVSILKFPIILKQYKIKYTILTNSNLSFFFLYFKNT